MAAAEDPKAAQETVVDVILAQADALERLIKRKSAFREEEFEDGSCVEDKVNENSDHWRGRKVEVFF